MFAEFSRFALLAEGLESAVLACSLILLGPGAAVGLAARAAAIPAITAYAVGVLTLSWLRLSERGGNNPRLLIAIAFLLATILLLVPLINRLDLAAIPAGVLAGAATAELWLPCGGTNFDLLVAQLPERGASGLGWLALYLAGNLAPLAVLAALHHLTPDAVLERLEPIWSVVGGTMLAVLAATTAVGLHDDLVVNLARWGAT